LPFRLEVERDDRRFWWDHGRFIDSHKGDRHCISVVGMAYNWMS
jgi:hypothetical protein